jgi:type II secretion system protein G
MILKTKGFTLIELLIVVAIIGILAAIAVPNFLNAQIRAKVSRVQADFKAISTALEMYKMDNNRYISRRNNISWPYRFHPLTTPVSYLSKGRWPDPFAPQGYVTPDGDPINYVYESKGWDNAAYGTFAKKFFNSPHEDLHGKQDSYEFALVSAGPDADLQADAGAKTKPDDVFFLYDASNGTISAGDLIRFGP